MVKSHGKNLWVGLTNRKNKDEWRFITDNTINKMYNKINLNKIVYKQNGENHLFPWAAGEPNNEGGEHCARVQHWKKISTTGLIDVDCSASIYGLCEIKK